MEGWIKLHRQFINWEWYKDTNTKILFIHLLLLANHETNKWQGNLIRRGQLITSYAHLADDLKMSVHQVRTAMEKLKKTGELTIQATSKYSLITIEKYSFYQGSEYENGKQNDIQMASEWQADGKQVATNNNDKNEKNNINNNISTNIENEFSESFQKIDRLFSKYRME